MKTSNRVTAVSLGEGIKDDWKLPRQREGVTFQEEETPVPKAWRQEEAWSSEKVKRKPSVVQGYEGKAEDELGDSEEPDPAELWTQC